MSENIQEKNQEIIQGTISFSFSKKKAMYAGVVALIVVFTILAFSTLTSYYKPQSVMDKFLEAMQSQNYEKAYKYLSLPKDKNAVVSREHFVASMKTLDSKFGKIKDYRFDPVGSFEEENQTLKRNGDVTYKIVEGRNQQQNLILTLHNDSTGKKADWKVIADDFYTDYNFEVSNLKGLKIDADGINLTVGDNDRLSIKAFKYSPFKLSFEAKDIKSKTFIIPDQEKALKKIGGFKANDKIQKELEEVLMGYLDAQSKAGQDNDVSHFVPYLIQKGLFDDLKSMYESHKENNFRQDFKASDIKFEPAYLEDEKGITTAYMDASVHETDKIISGQGEDSDYVSHNSYVFEKQPDGRWLLTWINNG